MINTVNICGIPHKIILCEDSFNTDLHFGQIDYAKCEIKINKDLPHEAQNETLVHEILHGILVHLGYTDEAQNETFVQALANAINQTFTVKGMTETKSVSAQNKILHNAPPNGIRVPQQQGVSFVPGGGFKSP